MNFSNGPRSSHVMNISGNLSFRSTTFSESI